MIPARPVPTIPGPAGADHDPGRCQNAFMGNVSSSGAGSAGGSTLSIGSSGSILSIGSNGSILSIGSTGSVLSIGSAGSFASIGSVASLGSFASALSIGSLFSFASVASGFSACALKGWGEGGPRRILRWRGRGARRPIRAARPDTPPPGEPAGDPVPA
jgi:hypothetical protein